MLKIGLTGGIGSGKSVVSDTFKELGVDIIDTDIIARTVLIDSPYLIENLVDAFGNDIIDDNGELIRTKLGDIAFKNKTNKETLDNIMHPAIRGETIKQIEIVEKESPPYCIVVVPLLVETGFKALVDRVLVVTAPHNKKLDWLKNRSQMDREKAENIIQSQSSDDEKLQMADDHLQNDLDINHLQNKVKKLHDFYLHIANKNQF